MIKWVRVSFMLPPEVVKGGRGSFRFLLAGRGAGGAGSRAECAPATPPVAVNAALVLAPGVVSSASMGLVL